VCVDNTRRWLRRVERVCQCIRSILRRVDCGISVDQKGVVVHSAGRALYGYNLSNAAAFFVANTSNPVSVLDVDSMLGYVYWIDGSRMRRARLNGNDKLVAPPQDLCAVKNASGIASDWITRSVELQWFLTASVLTSAEKIRFCPSSPVLARSLRKLWMNCHVFFEEVCRGTTLMLLAPDAAVRLCAPI